jgi:exopolysaccharide production protein ExoZ
VIYGLCLPQSDHRIPADRWDGLANLTFMNGWFPGQANAIVPGGWSISAEASFALLFVVAVPWLSTSRCALWMTIVGWGATWVTTSFVADKIAAFVGKPAFGHDVEYFPWTHMPTFIAGIWCWHVWNDRNLKRVTAAKWIRITCAGAAAALFLVIPFHTSWTAYRTLIVGPASALLLHAWTSGPIHGSWLWPLVWLGRLSFGIYLMHFELIGVAKVFVVGLLPLETASLVLFLATLLLTLIFTAPLAWLSFELVEQPIHRWVCNKTAHRAA